MQESPFRNSTTWGKVAAVIALALGLLATLYSGNVLGAAQAKQPLEGETGVTICHPATGHARFILGDEDLTNLGSRPAVILSVRALGAKNMKVVRTYVTKVPSKGPSLSMGLVNGPPPEFYEKGQAKLWRARHAALGAHVPPTSKGSDMNLLILVKSLHPKRKSTLSHFRVRYRESGTTYSWTSKFTYRIVPGKTC